MNINKLESNQEEIFCNIKHIICDEFFNKYSCILNSSKYIVGLINLNLCDKDCFLGLDCHGLLYIWIIHNDLFNFDNSDNDELVEFSDYKVIYPEFSFELNKMIIESNPQYPELEKAISYTSLEKLNDEFLIICGEFNTTIIKKEQIEKRIFFGETGKNNFRNSLRIQIKSISNDYTLKDSSMCGDSLINGIDIDYENNKLVSFSDNGYIFLYDTKYFELITYININTLSQFKNSNCSILSAKFLIGHKKISLGTNQGNLIFLNYDNLSFVGYFNIQTNRYLSSHDLGMNSDLDFDYHESINCIEVSQHYMLVGTDNFFFKYNIQLNLITQVVPSIGQVNSIKFHHQLDEIYIASNSNKLLKFNTSGKLTSVVYTSSKCLYNLQNYEILKKKIIACSGNSQYIDIIADDILLKLIY